MKQIKIKFVQGFAGILVLLIAGSLSGCGKNAQAVKDANENQDLGIPVVMGAVFEGPIANTMEITGSIIAETDVQLTAKMNGRIDAVYVREGDLVKKGQALIQQDASDLLIQRNQVTAALQMAIADKMRAESGIIVAESSYISAKTASEAQPKQTAAAIAGAEAQLKSAEARLKAIKDGARPQEREQAKQAVLAAKSNMERASADYQRLKGLAEQGAISPQQLDSAKTAYDAAKAQYETAVQTLKLVEEGARQEDIDAAEQSVKMAREQLKLAKTGEIQITISKQNVSAAEANLKQAKAIYEASKAAVSAATAQLKNIDKQIANMTVRSSIDGYVAERFAQPGQTGMPGVPLLRIVDLNTVVYEGQIAEKDITHFKEGQDVDVKISALNGNSFKAKIMRIYPVANETSRSFNVRIKMNNKERVIKPGMFAVGKVVVDSFPKATLIPKSAVVQVSEDTWVFTVADNKAKKVPVKVLFTDDKNAMITGLKVGDPIVVEGQQELQDDTLVAVTKPEAQE